MACITHQGELCPPETVQYNATFDSDDDDTLPARDLNLDLEQAEQPSMGHLQRRLLRLQRSSTCAGGVAGSSSSSRSTSGSDEEKSGIAVGVSVEHNTPNLQSGKKQQGRSGLSLQGRQQQGGCMPSRLQPTQPICMRRAVQKAHHIRGLSILNDVSMGLT